MHDGPEGSFSGERISHRDPMLGFRYCDAPDVISHPSIHLKRHLKTNADTSIDGNQALKMNR
jgi:hypothetical protein